MILHKVDLSDRIGASGVYVDRRRADAVDVSGRLYVDPHGGRVLIDATSDGWHDSREASLLAAAGRLRGWAERLTEQAEKLEREAGA